MINVSDVATGLLGLGVIAGAVCLVAIGGRKDDGHTVADYQPAAATETVPCPTEAVGQVRRSLRPGALMVLGAGATVTPLGPPEWTAPLDTLPAPTTPTIWDHMVARRWLEEIAAVEQSKAGIRPAYATAERDLTGAFPVVRAA